MEEEELQYRLETAAFEEKISLAELEESKAAERVRELKYERARFRMQWVELSAKAVEAKAAEAKAAEAKAAS